MGKNKIWVFVIAFFLLLVFSIAHAEDEATMPLPSLAVWTGSDSFAKGETISATVHSEEGRAKIKLFWEDVLVKEEEKTTDYMFPYEYELGFSDPSGNWKIIAEDSLRSEEASFTVTQSEESAFYLITVNSPSKTNFIATEDVTVSVAVTDAGNPVERATVYAWNPIKGKILLESKGNGIYSGQLELPVEMRKGNYDIVITAEYIVSGTEKYGGERKLTWNISNPQIELEIAKPSLLEARVEQPIEILVVPKYETGKAVENCTVFVQLLGSEIELEKSESGYTAVFTPTEEYLSGLGKDSFEMKINAYDDFGNTGTKTITIKVVGFEQNFWQKNLLNIVLVILGAIVLCAGIFWQYKLRKCIKGRSEKIRELKMQMKQLEDSFYKNSSTDRKTFEQTMQKYKEELNEVKRKG
ncbi:MAG: hypothetical protein JW772_05235 [Candidatus Diapherotrites archaeon]|nr:hypothetical protein [Candidatus Diapherotrites archaeon]